MSDKDKGAFHVTKITEIERRVPSGDKLVEKGSRLISQGPPTAPPPPASPSASADAPAPSVSNSSKQ
jgi:hypothetical protein